MRAALKIGDRVLYVGAAPGKRRRPRGTVTAIRAGREISVRWDVGVTVNYSAGSGRLRRIRA